MKSEAFHPWIMKPKENPINGTLNPKIFCADPFSSNHLQECKEKKSPLPPVTAQGAFRPGSHNSLLLNNRFVF